LYAVLVLRRGSIRVRAKRRDGDRAVLLVAHPRHPVPPPLPSQLRARLDFYGFLVEISGAAGTPVDEVAREFSAFRTADAAREPDARIEIRLEPPDWERCPPVTAAFLTPRNVCYRDRSTTYIDYFGEGLAIHDRTERRCTAFAADPGLLREIVYYFVLSTVGEELDAKGLHRLHALGVSYRERGVLLLLPSGGGKSTMALRLIREPGFKLLAEDTPLIDHRGRVHPFPLRMGVRPGRAAGIPPQFVRTIERLEFGPKTLIDVEYFRDRIGEAVDPGWLLVGKRSLGTGSEITPLGRRAAFKALVANLVVGLGVYQGLEFLLEREAADTARLLRTSGRRLRAALALMRRAPAYRFLLGRDVEHNTETLLEFLRERADARR
jgi:hypothetical protein